ncbi:MAG: hypothetical protein MAG431_00631 [Chloroflexi bacterium]|nr:hypothetical protein [Chloroflexota bacterium]
MKHKNLTPLSPNQAWPRDYLIRMLQVALSVNEYTFVRRAAVGWLSTYRGDLRLQFLHALALWKEERPEQALSNLNTLCQKDPEYLEAQKLRVVLQETQKENQADETWGAIFALSPRDNPQSSPKVKNTLPTWSKKVAKARLALERDEIKDATRHIQEAMAYEIETPLAAVTHLRVMTADPDTPLLAIQSLSEYYHQKWPACLLPGLVLADSLNQNGQSEKGVGMLHKAATEDVTGQVAERLWGDEHAYRDLWPEDLRAHLAVRVPAPVSAALGWNQLPAPDPHLSPHPNPLPGGEGIGRPSLTSSGGEGTRRPHPSPLPEGEGIGLPSLTSSGGEGIVRPASGTSPEELISIQKELERAARRLGRPSLTKRDGRFPMYVAFSTRHGLEKKYGPKTTQVIKDEMEKLASAVREKSGWGAATIFVDEASSMAKFDLKPVQSYGAWEFKLALADLDAAFAKKGLMIGALLIVGGPDVVPFHRLPNPVEDADADVPSDNPYATRDENYFIPEWQVARMPGDAGKDPSPLLSMLRKATEHHRQIENRKWWKKVYDWIVGLFFESKREYSAGYSAEAWEAASQEVFRPIGNRDDLVTSPPYGRDSQIPVPVTRLGYFNLHGVRNNAPWYGQRDMTKPGSGVAYPIALRPEDIKSEDDSPLILFSEACYGAHLEKRGVEDSLALKFLWRGSQAVAGSTVTSYGSVAGPLIAADLLGLYFWQYLKRGHSSGEALRKAKISLAQKMHKRQGYLDGEDQKTLLSFVLYGDPLVNLDSTRMSGAKQVQRAQTSPPKVKTVCSRCTISEDIPPDVERQVRTVVEKYLPGMKDAHLSLGEEHGACLGEDHLCPTSQLGAKSLPGDIPHHRVVTMRKHFSSAEDRSEALHEHYAQITLDEQGKVVKLAVSR